MSTDKPLLEFEQEKLTEKSLLEFEQKKSSEQHSRT